MKEEYVNPFLAPAKLVWEKELGQTLELASTDLVSHQFTTEDITALIGVSGQFQGASSMDSPRKLPPPPSVSCWERELKRPTAWRSQRWGRSPT